MNTFSTQWMCDQFHIWKTFTSISRRISTIRMSTILSSQRIRWGESAERCECRHSATWRATVRPTLQMHWLRTADFYKVRLSLCGGESDCDRWRKFTWNQRGTLIRRDEVFVGNFKMNSHNCQNNKSSHGEGGGVAGKQWRREQDSIEIPPGVLTKFCTVRFRHEVQPLV